VGFAGANPMQGAQVDNHVDQGVLVGDGVGVAQVRRLDAEGKGLAVDSFSCAALVVELLVGDTLSVQLVADASADTGGNGGEAALLVPVGMVDGAVFTGRRRMEVWTAMPSHLVGDETVRRLLEGVEQGHGEAGSTQREAISIELLGMVLASGIGYGGKATCVMKVFDDLH
jgi:hypothetical protein